MSAQTISEQVTEMIEEAYKGNIPEPSIPDAETPDRDRPWVHDQRGPSGEKGDICPCGHQNGKRMCDHLFDDHRPEDFGLGGGDDE